MPGYHISLHFTAQDNRIVASTPTFFGSNPAITEEKGKPAKQALRLETELGFQLVTSLSPEQLAVARFSEESPAKIITGNQRQVTALEPRGIALTELTTGQQEWFLLLLETYVDRYELGFAADLRAKIEAAGIDNLYFAWAGGLQPGQGHYYRIQGPMLLIEYDNTQNDANHVHTVVRDLTNDFAEDILREHYQQKH